MCSNVNAICQIVCCLQKYNSWQNHLPSLLLLMAWVFGPYKLVNSSLNYRIKCIMAMAQWLTLLECYHIQWITSIEIKNCNCSVINQPQGSCLNLSCNNQAKDLSLVMYFHYVGTVTCFSTVHRTFSIYFASCHSMHAHLPLLLEASTHFPQNQTVFLGQIFLCHIQSVAADNVHFVFLTKVVDVDLAYL